MFPVGKIKLTRTTHNKRSRLFCRGFRLFSTKLYHRFHWLHLTGPPFSGQTLKFDSKVTQIRKTKTKLTAYTMYVRYSSRWTHQKNIVYTIITDFFHLFSDNTQIRTPFMSANFEYSTRVRWNQLSLLRPVV